MSRFFAAFRLVGVWVLIGLLTSSHSLHQKTAPQQNKTAVFENISYPEVLKKPILAAFSHYEDLQDLGIHIAFVLRDEISKSVMQAQPVVSSLLSDREHRNYRIKISRYINLNGTEIAIEKLPDEVLTGWFAHELGHIRDYLDRSNVGMVWFGLRYITSEDFLREAEWRADKYAVDAGLSDQLVEMRGFIIPDNGFEQQYCDRIGQLYPGCDNILNYTHEGETSADQD